MTEDIVQMIQNGRTDLYGELWTLVRPFIVKMARQRFSHVTDPGAVDVDDLVQSGFEGLAAAVQTFDPEGGSTFLPVLANCLKKSFNVCCGCAWERTARDPIHRAESIDVPVSDPDGPTVGDLLPGSEDVEGIAVDRVYQEQLHDAEERLLSRISTQGADVLRRYYFDGESVETIAQTYGVTPKQMHSRRSSYLSKLKERSRTTPEGEALRHFIEDGTNYFLGVGASTFQRTHTSAVEVLAFRREHLEDYYRERLTHSV